jgi:hypothetical protein
MKPLVSGAGGKRFVEPATETNLLFPSEVEERVATPAARQATHS